MENSGYWLLLHATCYMQLLLYNLCSVSCWQQQPKCYLLAAVASSCALMIRCADGFVGSSYNNNKLMARRRCAVSSITTASPMLGSIHACMQAIMTMIAAMKKYSLPCFLINQKHNMTPFSSLDTSRYAHLENVTSPSPSIKPEEITPLIMNALKNNDVPDKDAADTTQYVFRNNRTGE